MQNLIVFDGDDTLWSTMPLYDRAKRLFADCVESLVPSADDAIGRLDEIDHANVAHSGFSKMRFPKSMVEAYRALCLENGRPPESIIESRLLAVGQAVFTSPVVPFPDADECLARLTTRQARPGYQRGPRHPGSADRRVETGSLFLRYQHPRRENRPAIPGHLHDHGLPGNGPSATASAPISPSLRSACPAVLIPRTTWRYEDVSIVTETVRD